MRRPTALVSTLGLVAATLVAAAPARAVSDDVVISQVYGGGGNSGATYTHDFVELFNRGSTTVSLTGMSVQYASATGSFTQVTALSGTLAPGQYYLVQQAQGAGGTTPLPTPDAAGSIAMSASSGKVALVPSLAALGCNGVTIPCPSSLIKDLVGYGSSATYYETAPAPTTSNTNAAIRLDGGCTDRDDNSADFTLVSPTPRNSASPLNVCGCTGPYTPIHDIQGSGPAAAVTGNVTTRGVVTGDFETTNGIRGFYLQDANPDADPATSEGIFVYTGSADLVSAGEQIRVTGYARERYGQTTINGANSDGSAVPAANIAKCGPGTVTPVDVSMPFDSLQFPERYEGMLVRLPQSLVISEHFNYDRFGEVLLSLPLPGEDRPFSGTAVEEPGAAANDRTAANLVRRLTLDDATDLTNPASLRHPNGSAFTLANRFRAGDTVTNTVGVLGYDFDLYRIRPTGPADYTPANPRPDTPQDVAGSLKVASVNMLNYFLTADYLTGDPLDNKCGPAQDAECRGWDADQPEELTRQRAKLLATLSGLDADVIGLIEMENTPGVEPLADLVAGLSGYDYIDTGVIGSDTIRSGLIYRSAVVTPVGDHKVLDSTVDPRFLDTKNRPTLAQTFEETSTGEQFTVAVNHFKSKGSDCVDVGDPDTGDGQGNCNVTRTDAARALVDWLAGDPHALIVGDLNAYAMEDPVAAVKAGADDTPGTADDYTNLIKEYRGDFAYSYLFDGQAGYLDHALAGPGMADRVTGAAQWHINADEPDVLDYDTTFKPPEQDALYEANAYRSSDHDPVVVGLQLKPVEPPTPEPVGPTEPPPTQPPVPTEPPPTQPPPVTKMAQKGPKHPKRIKKRGKTVLTRKNAKTNVGVRIKTTVKGKRKKGKKVYFRVIKGPKGKVSVRTYGRKGWRLTLIHRARATDTYKAYKLRTVYKNGRKK